MKTWIAGRSGGNKPEEGDGAGECAAFSGTEPQAQMPMKLQTDAETHSQKENGPAAVLAGIGTGGLAQITWEGLWSLLKSDALLGAGRMVESGKSICRQDAEELGLGNGDSGKRNKEKEDGKKGREEKEEGGYIPPEKKAYFVSYKPDEMIAWIKAHPEIRRPVILYSGDAGFYSGAAAFRRAAGESGLKCRLLPGISSISALSAIVGRPWENAEIISLHGRALSGNEDWSLKDGRDRFLLLDGSESLHQVCRCLLECGQEKAQILVGENLGYEEEKVTAGSPGQILSKKFGRLSCAWIIPWDGDEPA